ncbi:MAG: algE [Planctomycetaceae bacterium]|nr:algE [Planctomycetaceae bacterium]
MSFIRKLRRNSWQLWRNLVQGRLLEPQSRAARRPAMLSSFEALENRVVLAASWTTLSASGSGPSNGQAMMLLSDGSILVQGGNNSSSTTMFKLSPQANTGSYVNGVWSDIGDMNEGRLFFTTAMLPDGRIFAIGGEYPKFSNTAEIYDPVADKWSFVDPIPTPGTRVDQSGVVTGASNASPIVITTGQTTANLQNGDTVTIANVAGNTAANGTWTIAGLTSTSFQLVGSTGNGSFVNDGQGTWTGPRLSQYGDDPITVLPNGQILAGFFANANTFLFNPAAPAGSQWSFTGNKLHNDGSDEEAWVKLPDNSILSYDIFSSQSGTFQGQRYIPSTGTWVDASTLGSPAPGILSDPTTAIAGDTTKFLGQGSELGPGFLLPDGRVFYFGANGRTAYYTPSTDLWTAGPAEPFQGSTQVVATDDPGAMLPNGHILIALSPLGNIPADSKGNPTNYNFPTPSYIYDYDPAAQTFTDVSPGGSLGGNSLSPNAFALNMIVLPSGQVMLADEKGGFQIFNEDSATGPQDAWRPTVTNIVDNGDGTFTLTGTQLNGISEGAAYGDDNEMASNYPILRFTDSGGNESYARTFNWSSTGVATGATPVSTQFKLPAGHVLSDFTSVTVIANGIPSAPASVHLTPKVIAPPNQSSLEGESHVFNLGSFIDSDSSHWIVDVNWGDGSAHTVFSTTTAGSLGTAIHDYVDDNPTGTPSDPYTLTVTVTDDDHLSGSSQSTVTVSNVAPVLTNLLATTIDENGVATLTGQIVDPGTQDTFTLNVNWGDALSPDNTQVFTFAAGTTSFSLTHQYLDDNPTGTPSDQYTIGLTVADDDTGMSNNSTQVTVNNVAPVLTSLTATTIDENGTTTLTGGIVDPGTLDTFTLNINWGDPLSPDNVQTVTYAAGTTAFSLTHQYLDDNPSGTPSDQYTIAMTISDDDTGTSNNSTLVTVNNVIPVITSHDNSASSSNIATAGQPVTVSGSFTDVGTLDTHQVSVDWNDGTTTMGTVTEAGGAGTFSGSHTYTNGGVFTVTSTLTDDDTGAATASETVFVTGVGIQMINGKNVLFVVGTNEEDLVAVSQVGTLITVTANFLPGLTHTRTFDSRAIDEIRVLLFDENDVATVQGVLTDPILIDGGRGDDTLNASANLGLAGVVLLGGDGNDLLTGNTAGRNILVGGAGKDTLLGGANQDILVGGFTIYDHAVADDNLLTNEAALLSIMAEWNSGRSLAARRANINGTGSGSRLNGSNFLKPGTTVFDDGDQDLLTGGLGADWFFLFNKDTGLDFLPLLGDVKTV